MERTTIDAIDGYVEHLFDLDADQDLSACLAAQRAAGLPEIQVSAVQGRFLTVLAQAVGARRILEIGSLGGYSTVCLARALPEDGRLVSLELQEDRAALTRASLDRVGRGARCEVRAGRAAVSLKALAEEGAEPFDLAFIDADKASYPQYLAAVRGLMRPGGLIIADNVLRRAVLDAPLPADPDQAGIRDFNASLPGFGERATILPLAGRKGLDGMALIVA